MMVMVVVVTINVRPSKSGTNEGMQKTYWWWWCPFGFFARLPTGVTLPLLASSSSSLSFLRLPRPVALAISTGGSGGASGSSRRIRSPALPYANWAPAGTGLEMVPTPVPIPENMRPNSLLMPGSPAGPASCGWAPCTACGSGEMRPLRLISWIPSRFRWWPWGVLISSMLRFRDGSYIEGPRPP